MQISRNAPKGASVRDNLLALMRQVKQIGKEKIEVAEKFNVVGFSGIPINRVYFNDRMDACAFIFRLEAEDRRLNLFEPGSYKVVIVEDRDE